MGLHAILEEIRACGQTRIRELEAQAYAKAREITANARLEAELIQEKVFAAAVEPAAKERARIIHRARLEALQITGDERETFVDTALGQSQGRLAGIRRDPAYAQILRRLTNEALLELESSQQEQDLAADASLGHLEADPRDREILESLLNEMGLDIPLSFSLKCWGGLAAKSKDGRVVVINTLEARLERATPYLRRSLAALFEKGLPMISQAGVIEKDGERHRWPDSSTGMPV